MSPTASFSPKQIMGLLKADFTNVLRDPTMFAVLLLSTLPLALFLFFRTIMDEAALSAFEIISISFYIAPLVLIFPAYLIGWVTGFLILEEHDDGPLMALEVTPLGKDGVATYRAALAFIVTAVISLIALPFLFPNMGPVLGAYLILLSALQAAMINFVLPAIAKNKVQGLAMTKGLNLFAMAPLLAFIPSPWRFIAGPIPGFWVGELSKAAGSDQSSIFLLMFFAAIVHILVLILLFRFFSNRTL